MIDTAVFIIVFLSAIFGAMISGVITWIVMGGKVRASYLEGIQEGHAMETEHLVRKAIAEDRAAIMRRMHDNGRRAPARPGAEPARIHKVKMGPRRPGQPTQ